MGTDSGRVPSGVAGDRRHVRPIRPCGRCGGAGSLYDRWRGPIVCDNCHGAKELEDERPWHGPAYGLIDYAAAIADDFDLSPERYQAFIETLTGAVEDVVDDLWREVVAVTSPARGSSPDAEGGEQRG